MYKPYFYLFIYFWCFNATFSNISAISWRPVLVVEEAGVPGENHRPWPIPPQQTTGKRYHLRLRVECTIFCKLQIIKKCTNPYLYLTTPGAIVVTIVWQLQSVPFTTKVVSLNAPSGETY
jgi:hypothetical protein